MTKGVSLRESVIAGSGMQAAVSAAQAIVLGGAVRWAAPSAPQAACSR